MSNFSKVFQFMHSFGQETLSRPTLPDNELADLRLDLIQEEVGELLTALEKKDFVEIADALTDILYVTYGAGHAFGLDLDECFEEVHQSNMSKLGIDGKPIYRQDGKVLKGRGYKPPQLARIIQSKLQGDYL